ncbi:MAG: hypothetical protein Q8891_06955 [Bacteroidota bacterium]|nr:hypothetical protein [Bacteroidota bacterium]
MKQMTNSQSFALTKKDNDNLQPNHVKSSRIKNILTKIFLTGIMFFGFISFSLAQNTTYKNASYKKDLLKEKREISEKLRTEKKELNNVKSILNKISDMPTLTVEKFKTDFPKAQNVNWLKTDGYIEVNYKLNNSQMVTFYDFNNNLIGTGKYVTYQSLPARSLKKIAKDYKGYKPEKVMYFDDNDQNANNMNFFGSDIDVDDYYALLRDKKNAQKEIVLQITPTGQVSYFSDVRHDS